MSGEGRRLVIALGLPDRRLCGNGYLGKFARGRVVKEHRESACRAALAALETMGSGSRVLEYPPPFRPDARVRVDVTVRRDPLWAARRLDDDNLIRGLKAQIDGLTDAGVWADDRQVQWGTITWETAPPYRGGVVLTLTEQGG